MNFSDAVNYCHDNISTYNVAPYFIHQPLDLIDVVLYYNKSSIWILPSYFNTRIDYTFFDKNTGCIVHHRSCDKWFIDGKTYTIPKINASTEKWFNFSLQHELTKDLYFKYLTLMNHVDSILSNHNAGI